jgi:hypothetical protein
MTSTYILISSWLCFKKQYTKMSFWFKFVYIIVISPFRGKMSTNELLALDTFSGFMRNQCSLFFWRTGAKFSPVLGSRTHHNRSVQLQIRHLFCHMCQVTSNSRGSFFKFLLCRAVFLLVFNRFDRFLKTCRH